MESKISKVSLIWVIIMVGFARNAAFNTHTCMVYNMCRYEQILRLGMN